MAIKSATRGIAAATMVLLGCGIGAGLKSADSGHSYGQPVTAITADGLPACVTEDGAGMALCYWDADSRGNHLGTSVVSGDCAPDVMGGRSALCVRLYNVPDAETLNRACKAVKQQGGWTAGQCVTVWNDTH